MLSSVTDEFVAEFQHTDLAEIRRRGGIVRDHAGHRPTPIPTPFVCSGDKQPHEPAFAHLSHNFRKVVAAYAEGLIALDGRVIEPQIMRWCATALSGPPTSTA